MYLIDNFYFQSVKTSIFKKKYYKHFQKFEIARGETLTREGETVSHLYLIKEGEVEVKTNKTLLELNNLLKILEELLGEKMLDKGGLKSGRELLIKEPINHLKDLQKKKLIRV
jgi:CRP-like cAMP-binding protein